MADCKPFETATKPIILENTTGLKLHFYKNRSYTYRANVEAPNNLPNIYLPRSNYCRRKIEQFRSSLTIKTAASLCQKLIDRN